MGARRDRRKQNDLVGDKDGEQRNGGDAGDGREGDVESMGLSKGEVSASRRAV